MSEKQTPNKKSKPGLSKPKFNPTWIYIGIAVFFLILSFIDFGNNGKEIGWKKFVTIVKDNDVKKIVIVNGEIAEIYLTKDAIDSQKYKDLSGNKNSIMSSNSPNFRMSIGSIDTFQSQLDEIQKNTPIENRIDIKYEKRTDYMSGLMSWIIPILLFFGIWFFLFRKASGGGMGGGSQIFNIGKSKAKIFDKENNKINVDFKDVAGMEEAKVEIIEIVDFLKNSEKYTRLGGKIPKGVLLIGPPGTGKTLLARAVAGEANVPFFSMSGSDFVEMFVGVGASRVRDLFKQAKDKSPCIIFIDEIDAIGRARGKNANFNSNDERENTLNQLLTEMDGFEPNNGVIIIAATNRADILDNALTRAGRFDRQIHVELPDLKERKDIFLVHTKNLKLGKNVNLNLFSKQTPGFSGADIANVCNESALIAARRGHNEITKQDFLDAIDRIIGGLEKRHKLITPQEKKTIAFHEGGHATVSWILPYAHPLVKVTIVPRGKALGAAWYMPEERQLTTKEQILDEMCAALGGRASEEINFGKISTGALNDLERITKQAYAMVTYFGMSPKIGNISYYDSSGRYDYNFTKPYSEKVAEKIDEEAKKIVDEQYERAKKILRENAEGLKKLSEKLLEKEVIFSEDLEEIFGKRKDSEGKIIIEDEDFNDNPSTEKNDEGPEKTLEKPEKQTTTEKPVGE